uniref:ATP synthase subunit a n=1 Tax=Nyctiophylax orbicularis TaxID=2904907 RepID=A0A9E8LP28_9NEOP|nr:ATP synthase F0 subunit 6 [Nyctiophylax orbicularis]UZZ44199.1 ATP synthase F0 subunit 6 [Nyctiophylax orbicularis]
MMNNLFSIFDPMTIMNSSMNWISMILIMMIMPNTFFVLKNRNSIKFQILIKYLLNEFKTNTKTHKYILIPISMFMLIMLNNIISLPPYIFTTTSHLQLNLLMSIPIWLSIMIMGWTFNMKNMLYHLVPNGTPSYLMVFMVLIETISNIIRPLTLTVRLTANLIAGHLLLSLLSSIKSILSYKLITLMIAIQSILITLEMSVAIIQAYVFSLLTCLYFMDSN